ncbi:MAG: hypothetical protein HS130_01000 [Deltaproteobacteria bacterium]|nr:hypothetical protein [Deltaproteobacteria bacterium]MCL4873836.1 hypothetical protein [bacterium]
MNDAEYKATQEQILFAAFIIDNLDLNTFLQRIARTFALGPIIAPTLYKKGMDKLDQVRRLAIAAQHFQGEVHRQKEEARKAGEEPTL